ncbi:MULTISPECIES: methyl-accepting chemotaxis protein [Alphaproteobacteria]|uniref:Methyl-accepting chemotaxis protein n=2 Tax=Alphaproteobacteria TaxID=28211 RepID=A0A512HD80_9HYPH|nr:MULTISPECIES: methyl-accepting chemotaxis protein [Alphaproteobacteria]GEO83413.1 methyl-accepting chemotaxis protein [Ciceribacter naphthalenivorans]GLR23014.1 methyl-accepting chemotaxis protein [Ciceribacter naphthalenivorans]GLT05870.1 methyl-accepting chemotaxis protein [Sphingomonas psychrolutea]
MKNLSISIRLYLLVALALSILVATLTFSLFHSYYALAGERRAGLAAIDQTALAVFAKYHKMEQDGALTREEAQAKALEVVGAMRYGKDGYLWVNDMQPVMVMHPIKPELVGKDLSGNKDPNGKHIFMEFVKTVKESKEGFVDYYWPKPGFDAPVLKFSHVVGFEPWGWIVGTGVYADDLAAMFYSNALWFGAIIVASVFVILACAYAVVRSVVRPIGRLRTAMGQIAEERVETDIIDAGRKDEIGGMADALLVLRDSVRERIQMRGRETEQQLRLDAERQSNETVLRTASERQNYAIHEIGNALEGLAQGDLTVNVGDLGAEYDKLRQDFNAAVAALSGVVASISQTSNVVSDSASDISEATNNLSKRTEQQAAALEETAAALDEITVAVRTASERADEARDMVSETKRSANRSGEIVRTAVDAMGRIENSSNRISQIIGVIDEIAFQTNLLALNAGVEAARAGEAGRGFAVVAQEVRELAQRSANAAKEIKTLISDSATEVGNGVSLVRSTGEALIEIEKLVNQVNDHVNGIATASREQATGLQEINTSVNHMDQMTQQNAAMVEETSAAGQTLAEESRQLRELLSRLKIDARAIEAASHRHAA